MTAHFGIHLSKKCSFKTKHTLKRSTTVRRILKLTATWGVMLLCVITSSFSTAQSEVIFTVDQLQEDLSFWRNRLETKHPLIYLYRTKVEVDHFFDSLNSEIDHPMTEIEFFKLVAPVSWFLCDGHNTILPTNSVLDEMRETKLLLPFDLTYFEGRLHVIRNLSDNLEIKLGDEIKAINGIEVSKIREQILHLVPKEGNSDQLGIGVLNDLFRFYYHILYGFSDQHQLTIRYPDDSEMEFSTNSRNLTDIRATRTLRHPEFARIPRGIYFKELDEGKSAILTISTFDQETLKHSKQRFRPEIRGVFKQLKKSKTQNLIIDLRDNEGGNPDLVKVLLKHLFDHRFEQAKEFRIVKNPSAENFTDRTKKKWYPGFGIGKYSPAHTHFDGKILVLQNENTFSAGVEVLSVLRKYDRATFLGRESGGNPVIMGGFISKTRWKLPNTKLQFSSGTHCTLYEDFDKNTGRGIIPDIEIPRNLSDALNKKDACLEFALEMLREGK